MLSIFYFPISGFSMLIVMASEGTIGVTNQLYINLITVFCYLTISIPILCIICIALSVILRIKRKNIASFCIQFIPLVIFILNISFFLLLKNGINNVASILSASHIKKRQKRYNAFLTSKIKGLRVFRRPFFQKKN